jgi:hypothetical protein
MRNFVAARGKTLFVALLALTFAASAYAQPSLNNQMDADNDGKADFMVFRPRITFGTSQKPAAGLSSRRSVSRTRIL